MFDTMVITKVVAGLCATLLFLLLGIWAADVIYLPKEEAGHEVTVYPLPVDETATQATAAVAAAPVDVMALYAQADAAAGENLWRSCRTCHQLNGTDGTGPHLNGVVGRPIDGVAGFNYSGALLVLGDTWTVEALNTFLENPRSAAPGTRMSFRGFSNIQDRLNLIAYLQTTSP